MQQPYEQLVTGIKRLPDRAANMQAFVDLLWDALHPMGVSWLGFYLHESGDQLVLGPRRDKPACSPIGLHGVCGQAFSQRRAIIVRDVSELGSSYIACDPKDRSEVVVPLFTPDGTCWGVFDADSYELAAFDDADVKSLTLLLERAGLTTKAGGGSAL